VLTSRWQISAGEITGWLPPLYYAFAALASAWTLHDARRRFPLYAVAAWTLATLIYAPIVLPLYLVARIFKPHPAARDDAAAGTTAGEETEAADAVETCAGGDVETDKAVVAIERGAISDDGEQVVVQRPQKIRTTPLRLKRYAPPLAYALALLAAGAVYVYRDYHSFDAHLARAANARLLERRAAAIREYRAALRLNDDAHTHKLLAVQLAEDGQIEAALAEFRAAERGGEPDELLALRVASALDALGRAGEADDEYQKFLQGSLCASASVDARCVEAAARLAQTRGGAVVR
jgi:tetratricopeptide (TPR) repeat protein